MADVPQLRSDLLPVPVAPPGQLFGHAHSFGVAHDLELLRQGFTPCLLYTSPSPRDRG